MNCNRKAELILILAISLNCVSIFVGGVNASKACVSSQVSVKEESHTIKWQINGLVDTLASNDTFKLTTDNIRFNSKIVPGNWLFTLSNKNDYSMRSYISGDDENAMVKNLVLSAVYTDANEILKGQLNFEVALELSAKDKVDALDSNGRSTDSTSPAYDRYRPASENFHHYQANTHTLTWDNILDSVQSITSSADSKDFAIHFHIKVKHLKYDYSTLTSDC